MLLAGPTNASFRPVALTVAALAVAGGTAFTAHAVLADTPTRGHTPATVTPVVTAPGYDPRSDGLNPVEREAAQRLAELRAQRAADFQCIGPAYPARPC